MLVARYEQKAIKVNPRPFEGAGGDNGKQNTKNKQRTESMRTIYSCRERYGVFPESSMVEGLRYGDALFPRDCGKF